MERLAVRSHDTAESLAFYGLPDALRYCEQERLCNRLLPGFLTAPRGDHDATQSARLNVLCAWL